MSKQTEQIAKLLKVTGRSTIEQAVQVAEKGITIAARQDYVLSHLGAITIVYSPAGLMSFTVPPEAGMSLEHLAIIENAVLQFQQALIERRLQLTQPVAQPQPMSEGETTPL